MMLESTALRILVLGSAAGGGVPQWNSRSEACRLARAHDPASPPRTQASLAVSVGGERWFLLDASPDLRQQIQSQPALHARAGRRSSPIAGAVVTGADVDRIAGLLTLREGQPLALYATAAVLRVLDDNPIFEVLNRDLVPRRALPLGASIPLLAADGAASGIEVEAFAVPGKVPLYLEDRGSPSAEHTIGLEVRAVPGGQRFFYVPGCAAVTPELARRLAGAPLVFFDGTLWTDDEMIVQGVGHKTGQRMAHMSIAGPQGSLRALAPLSIRRKVFLHVNNTNPLLLASSPERRAAREAGWEMAHDGMELIL